MKNMTRNVSLGILLLPTLGGYLGEILSHTPSEPFLIGSDLARLLLLVERATDEHSIPPDICRSRALAKKKKRTEKKQDPGLGETERGPCHHHMGSMDLLPWKANLYATQEPWFSKGRVGGDGSIAVG